MLESDASISLRMGRAALMLLSPDGCPENRKYQLSFPAPRLFNRSISLSLHYKPNPISPPLHFAPTIGVPL
jgi:hypothetical protein